MPEGRALVRQLEVVVATLLGALLLVAEVEAVATDALEAEARCSAVRCGSVVCAAAPAAELDLGAPGAEEAPIKEAAEARAAC